MTYLNGCTPAAWTPTIWASKQPAREHLACDKGQDPVAVGRADDGDYAWQCGPPPCSLGQKIVYEQDGTRQNVGLLSVPGVKPQCQHIVTAEERKTEAEKLDAQRQKQAEQAEEKRKQLDAETQRHNQSLRKSCSAGEGNIDGVCQPIMTKEHKSEELVLTSQAVKAATLSKQKLKEILRTGKQIVLGHLKAPSTASFVNDEISLACSSDTFVTVHVVDAQNSFGAMIRGQVCAIFNLQTHYSEADGFLCGTVGTLVYEPESWRCTLLDKYIFSN